MTDYEKAKRQLRQRKIEAAKEFIEDKYDIVVDFFTDSFFAVFLIAFILAGGAFGIGAGLGLHIKKQRETQYEKYISTTIETENGIHNIDDVYAVYNAEQVWFCNRKLVAINEEEAVKGSTYRGTGNVSDYYYRDEIYEYYDLKTSERICQTHEDGFYIESLMDLYSEEEVIEHNYQLSLEDLEKENSIENMLSRNPGLKRK